MAVSSIVVLLVSYNALRPAPPLPPPLPHPPSCPAVADVEALQLQLEELKQRLTDLEAEGAARRGPPMPPVRGQGHDVTFPISVYNTS